MAGQPYIVVYADILLLSNFCLDFLTLWLAGRLAGRPGKGIRLALASGLGAAYALGAELWPYSPANSLLCRLAVSLMMVAVGLKPADKRWFSRLLVCFYLAAFAIGGSAFGLAYLLSGAPWLAGGGGVWPVERALRLPFKTAGGAWLAAGAAFGAVGIVLAARRQRAWASRAERRILEGEVSCQSGSLALNVLVDTGCDLVEPASGLPVLVTSMTVLARSPALAARLGSLDPGKLTRLPCRGVGGQAELPLFGQARLRLSGGESLDCWLALAPLPLSAAGDYDALMPPFAELAEPRTGEEETDTRTSTENPVHEEAAKNEPPANLSVSNSL